jgi:hypothetical protein
MQLQTEPPRHQERQGRQDGSVANEDQEIIWRMVPGDAGRFQSTGVSWQPVLPYTYDARFIDLP